MFNQAMARPRTRARSAIELMSDVGNCISNSLRTKSFNRIKTTRSRMLRTGGTLRRRCRRRRRCHKSSHIWSPTNAASRRSIGPGKSRRASRTERVVLFSNNLGHCFRHSILGWSTSNNVVSPCYNEILKPIHEDHSARVVGEHSIKHIQLSM